jgi:Zn-dependent protease
LAPARRPPPDAGVLDLTADAVSRTCVRCRTELAARALACPSCSLLVHRDSLQQLARLAESAASNGDSTAARAHWTEALDLVPIHSEQYQQISARLAALVDASDVSPSTPTPGNAPHAWWKPAIGGVAAVVLLLAGKLKFLLLGLGKMSTLLSMFGFIGVYWSIHGWPLAAGIAGSIYVHEMGHVAMLRRLGINASAPLFIPGVGALVMLKQHVTDPVIDARIGLAGPVWGLGAAAVSWLIYLATGAGIWLAIAELTGFLNLFNLTPIWQLDGARGFHALSRQQRWMVVIVVAVALLLTGVRMLWIVGAVAVYQACRAKVGPGHWPTVLTYGGLVLALSWFARAVH